MTVGALSGRLVSQALEPEPVWGMTRKLTAIIAADVVGYSRLMGGDEAGTLAALKTHRRELIDPKIAEHQGRIVKTTGDGLLIEFPSVVEAVQCAVEVQRAMQDRNLDVPADHRIEFRVGINLGDIIIDGDDIFGDGVNVAARLESIAEPGGICISSSAYDQVRDKLELRFIDLGEQTLKNIARPTRAYAVVRDGPGERGSSITPSPAAAPHLSIVVLPFANMGGDPEQDYFVDGVTEPDFEARNRDLHGENYRRRHRIRRRQALERSLSIQMRCFERCITKWRKRAFFSRRPLRSIPKMSRLFLARVDVTLGPAL